MESKERFEFVLDHIFGFIPLGLMSMQLGTATSCKRKAERTLILLKHDVVVSSKQPQNLSELQPLPLIITSQFVTITV